MFTLIRILTVLAIIGVALAFLHKAGCFKGRTRRVRLANIAEGRHATAIITRKADAAITERYRIVKVGSDASHIAITAAITDVPLGVCLDEPAAAEAVVSVQLLGGCLGTVFMRAAGAISADAVLEATANGRVQALTTSAGTHYAVGRAITAAANAGDIIEVDPMFQKIVSP